MHTKELTLLGLAAFFLAPLAHSATSTAIPPQALIIKRPLLAAPLDTKACNGTCLDYWWSGSNWTAVIRNPANGDAVSYSDIGLTKDVVFGASKVELHRGGDSTSPPPSDQHPLPEGTGIVFALTAVFDKGGDWIGEVLNVWTYDKGVVTNGKSWFAPSKVGLDHPQD